jgi:Tfp pilus assembly protein PilV
MKANQKGFSVVETLLVIVVVGLFGAVGWLVYDRQKNKESAKTPVPTSQKDETPKAESAVLFSATGISLDAAKLPKDWTATNDTADVVTLTSDGCFIEATKEKDATLSLSKQAEGIQTLVMANDKTGTKGYVVTDKGSSTLTVYTTSGMQKVTSYELLWDMPEGGNPFRYSRAYSIQDGYYVSLKRSCSSEADFANTDTAMSALIFKQ